jgi:hypothetical protein
MGKLATGIMTLWLGAAGAGGAIAAEPKHGPTMSTADLPAAVKSTFDKQAKGAPVQELRRESFNGQPVYSGEIVRKGKGTELWVSEQGKVVYRVRHDEGKGKGEKK